MKSDFVATLKRHTVDVKSVNAAVRDAPPKRRSASFQGYHFNNDMPTRLTEQKRLSVYNWNPGAGVEKEVLAKNRLRRNGTFSITLHGAIEYIDHEFLTTRFHVTHTEAVPSFSTKTLFFPDIKVTSIYFHDARHSQPDKVIEGETGWVIQGVVSKASFRRKPRGGKSSFTVMSLHINNNSAKKRGIGKKLLLAIRAVMFVWHWLKEPDDLTSEDPVHSSRPCVSINAHARCDWSVRRLAVGGLFLPGVSMSFSGWSSLLSHVRPWSLRENAR